MSFAASVPGVEAGVAELEVGLPKPPNVALPDCAKAAKAPPAAAGVLVLTLPNDDVGLAGLPNGDELAAGCPKLDCPNVDWPNAGADVGVPKPV